MTTRIGFGGGCLTLTGTFKGIVKRKVNDVTVVTDDHGTSCPASNHPIAGAEPYSAIGSYKHELIFDVQICSSGWKAVAINIYDYDTRVILKEITFPQYVSTTQDLNFSCVIYWNRRNDPDGTPSYLETLDKLDQWSTAQYIPNSGNKLNL